MIQTLAVSGYRSLRDVVIPLGQLTLVTGPNGGGKSNLYRALRTLADTAAGQAPATLAREGGLESILWAGPEKLSRKMKRGEVRIEGTLSTAPIHLRLGFGTDELSYSVEFGLPVRSGSAFFRDPEIKRECIWAGPVYRKGCVLVERSGPAVFRVGDDGSRALVTRELASYDTMMTRCSDPIAAPEVLRLRDLIRSWRFYDYFRTDADAPARSAPVAVRTPVLHHDGHDAAAAIQTLIEQGNGDDFHAAVSDAFPGSRVTIDTSNSRFGLLFGQDGLLRPLSQSELSDGTLRYLLWCAALLTVRPPALMVLNEPETSLHPELLPALARLIVKASETTQMWVISHSPSLIAELRAAKLTESVELTKSLSETLIVGQTQLTQPSWEWPRR